MPDRFDLLLDQLGSGDRFDSVLDKVALSGTWEQVTPVLQRRKKPGGGYEFRPTPANGRGAPGVGVVGEDPRMKAIREAQARTGMSRPESLPEQVMGQLNPRIAANLASTPELAAGAQGIAEKLNPGMRPRRPLPPGASPAELLNPRSLYPEPVREKVEAVYGKREEVAEELARKLAEAGVAPEVSALADAGLEAVAMTAGDLTNVLPGVGLVGGARRLRPGSAFPDAALSREASLAAQLPEAAPRPLETRGQATLARAIGGEEIGDSAASGRSYAPEEEGRRNYVTVEEDGRLRFDWRRQGENFPPGIEEWARGKGVEDFDLLSYREQLGLYGRMVAEEKAALAADARPDIVPDAEARVYRVGDREFRSIWQAESFRDTLDRKTGLPPPELTRERWEEIRNLPASRLAAGNAAPPSGFVTAKGSRYAIEGAGTRRSKLATGEEFGASRRTLYVTAEQSEAMMDVARGGKLANRRLRAVEFPDGRVGIGAFARDTGQAIPAESVVLGAFETAPRLGLHPFEILDDKGSFHVGHPIVSLGDKEIGALRIGPDPVRADPATETYRQSVFAEETARPPVRERLRQAKDQLLVEFYSKDDPYVARMAKAGAGEEGEILAHELRRAGHTSLQPITTATRRWDPSVRQWEATGEPLEAVTSRMDEATLRQVEAVMIAQSQVEFAAREAMNYQRRLAEAGPEGAGIEPSSFARTREAQDYLAQMRGSGELDKLEPHLKAARDWSDRAFLQPLERLGVFSADEVAEIRAKNRHHAIMSVAEERIGKGELRSGEAVSTRSSPVKRRERGLLEDEKYVPTFEAMAQQAARIDKFQVRQLVRNDLAERVVSSPELWPELAPAKPGEAGTFVAWKDGKQYAIKAPGDLLDVIDNIRPEQAGYVWRAARASASALRTLATLAPHFPGMNFLRDQPTAGVFSKSEKLFGFVPYYHPAKELFKEIGGKLAGKGGSKAWKEFQASAAGASTFLEADRQGMRRLMEEARLRATPGGRRRLRIKEALNPLFVPRTVGNALESATRIAEQEILKAEGKGARQATRGAATVSLDFSDGGRFAKKVNEVAAFFNVRFLDTARFLREIKRRPFTIAARATAFITLPALAEEWLHRDDPGYHDLPLWDQAAFYHLGSSTEGFAEGWYKRIPRPLGVVSYIFGLLPQLALRQAIREDPHAAELAMRGLLQDTPAGYMFSQNEQGGLAPSLEAVPTAARGAAELIANRRWTGAPVVRDPNLPPREQYTETTSPAVRELARSLPDAAPDFLQSPQQLEHLVSSQTAGTGRLALDVLNPAVRVATGEEEPPREPFSPRDVPVLRSFMSPPPEGFSSLPVQDLYRFADRVEALSDQLRRDPARREEILREYPEVKAAKGAAQAIRELAELRKAEDAILASQVPDELKRARLRLLRQRVTAYAERLMARWRETYPQALGGEAPGAPPQTDRFDAILDQL